LADESVQPDGIDLNYLDLRVEETFFRMLRTGSTRGAWRTVGADTCGITRAVSAADSAMPWARIPA
jgi:hypothetical protein